MRKRIFQISVGFLILFASCATLKRNQSQQNKSFTLTLPGRTNVGMIYISPGTFTMGSPSLETGRKPDEGPQTEVTLTGGYWLAKTEVTIGQWKAVTNLSLRDQIVNMLNDDSVYDFNGHTQRLRDFMRFDPKDPDKLIANQDENVPMYFVSWNDAIRFCKMLTDKERANGHLPKGYEYTLPTEAQWEYACRAGTTSATYAGDLIINDRKAVVLDSIAWYSGNSAIGYKGKPVGNSSAGPRNAGEKKSNAWGLQDMPGNLWEWCRDSYAPYTGGKLIDPVNLSESTNKVNRGGSWGSGPADERSANRASNPAPEKSAYRGFRIALCKI